MMITSLFLTLAFASIKRKETQLTENDLLKAFAIFLVIGTVSTLNLQFGSAGFNPALATSYIIFEVSQNKWPNRADASEINNENLNHYLWAYMIGPMVGGILGGMAHLVH